MSMVISRHSPIISWSKQSTKSMLFGREPENLLDADPVLKKKKQKLKLPRRVFMIALEKRNSRALQRKQRKL